MPTVNRIRGKARPVRVPHMPVYTMREAAELLGVSDDTIRRWVDSGRLAAAVTAQGHRAVDGRELAAFAVAQSAADDLPRVSSMRNRFPGIVTRVVLGDVAAQVEVQAGPHRFVSLLTREAVEELGLHEGDRAFATVKATNVAVEVPPR
jgi:molybdopterin-binding protein